MDELNLTGGAKIGMWSSSYPFATLKVNKNHLELNTSLVGNLIFQPSDIITLEASSGFSFIGGGMKIIHRVPAYKKKVVFRTLKDPKEVIKQIQKTGFLDGASSHQKENYQAIVDKQTKGGFPVKTGVVIGFIILWNLLFLVDFIPFFLDNSYGFPLGKGVIAGVSILFLAALLGLVSKDTGRLILKEGRDIDTIKRFAISTLFISGLLLVPLIIMISLNN